jgi:putative ABC transport system permease protein
VTAGRALPRGDRHLRATGWTDGQLGRLVACEGLGLGLIGSLTGAAAGLAGAAALAGALPLPLLAVAALAVTIGTLLGGAASVVPVALLGAQPLAPALAAE